MTNGRLLTEKHCCGNICIGLSYNGASVYINSDTNLFGTAKLFSTSKKCLRNNFFRNKCFPCLYAETNVDYANSRTFSVQPMKTKGPIAAKRKLDLEAKTCNPCKARENGRKLIHRWLWFCSWLVAERASWCSLCLGKGPSKRGDCYNKMRYAV